MPDLTARGSAKVRRGFVDVSGGQIHYREAGTNGGAPLVLIHASPGSARSLEPLMRALAPNRHVFAPDTMGNGDSSGEMPHQPEIYFFADRAIEALDQLGLTSFDMYGTHTGGSVAADTHITWAWHFVRDTYMFWPWYRTDAAHRRSIGLPQPDVLHDKVMDVLKAIQTYHLSYRAAFRFDKRRHFRLIRVPTVAACAESDMLSRWHDEFAGLIPGAVKVVIPAVTTDPDGAAAAIERFLLSP